jgi:hypothetical protein
MFQSSRPSSVKLYDTCGFTDLIGFNVALHFPTFELYSILTVNGSTGMHLEKIRLAALND